MGKKLRFQKCNLKEELQALWLAWTDEADAEGLTDFYGLQAMACRAVAEAPGAGKTVVCNADEGDPGAFMDRSILESDPHAVLEGMLIAARAINAHQGYIYARTEYPLAIRRLAIAIEQARECGLLGVDILGTGFDFDVSISRGAGAFVCGEETALIASLEGRRGMPRLRPPYPVEWGFRDRPTEINNVETLACVPWILRHGAEAFSAMRRAPGLK